MYREIGAGIEEGRFLARFGESWLSFFLYLPLLFLTYSP